ncbi:hypothetical protein D1BOALGB6SA_4917 [Olavius sp. associated proteobacterium Delta 1]|nr:hypothetical protein D1BOALGB6SA_4917 [Olavius sp. associated proteobacterium Delta 1]
MWIIRRSTEIRCEIGFNSANGEPIQVSWKRIRNSYSFIPKSMGFSQT